MPLFSVIVPVFNHARYIGEALDSLISQTCQDWEAVVVNDGSTDGTAGIIDGYAARDRRIRVIHKANGGVASALNTGLRNMEGAWFCWLSSDDLFDPVKLQYHQEWIARYPSARFFCTDAKELEDETGDIREGPLWTRPPAPEWQVLEMLRCTFVHGNSVCVRADLVREAGWFDESLRYAQDYDYWLRLLLREPVVHIPVRTCITRCHSAQVTSSFPQALVFESARVAINILNRSRFSELVRGAVLSDKRGAVMVVQQALTVVSNPGAFLYALGAHPLLLWRLQEWIWNEAPTAQRGRLKRELLRLLPGMIKRQESPFLRFFLKVGKAYACVDPVRFEGGQWPLVWIAETWFRHLRSQSDPQADQIKRYAERWLGMEWKEVEPQECKFSEVLVVNQKHVEVEGSVFYGTGRAALELVKGLRQRGVLAVAFGIHRHTMGFIEGELALGAPTEGACRKLLKAFVRLDAAVGVSRSDIITMVNARRYVLYWHDPLPLQLSERTWLRLARVPTVCVSEFSRNVQRKAGMEETALHVVPNGYDHRTFLHDKTILRKAHSLIFAGTLSDYKGVDRALLAFSMLQKRYPDATLRLFGRECRWTHVPSKVANQGWMKADRVFDWEAVTHDCPGVFYGGEITASELSAEFNAAEYLVLPSRNPESFGLVSIEAQACGCIPVLPRQGGFPETMLEGETGFLYDDNSVEGLVAAITRLWQEGEDRDDRRTATAENRGRRFSWADASDTIGSILNAPGGESLALVGTARLIAWLATWSQVSETALRWRWRWQVVRRRVRPNLSKDPVAMDQDAEPDPP